MNYLKRLKIHGLKKFKDFDIEFNEGTNLLVGENESGKSTILEAIEIILEQKYKTYDKYIIKELLNKEYVEAFKNNPCVENLPRITIDAEFVLDDIPSNILYRGQHHGFESNNCMSGIHFECKVEDEEEVLQNINEGNIPYDYYQMSWNTFQGDTYKLLKKPIKFLMINNDNIDANTSYNYFNKTIFNSNHDEKDRLKIKSKFRDEISNAFNELPINKISDSQEIAINDKKMIFENIITILDDNIPIENKGSGRESIIKTEMALNKNTSKIDILAIEEPENHLSYSNLKLMIEKISLQEQKQLIITTHNSMITNSLNLKNIIWVGSEKGKSLKDIDQGDCDFFLKSTNNNMLHFILSEKVILVEGPTEFLLVPEIFKKLFNTSLEENKISIIDCSGISYKRYISIAKTLNKKVAILTDNDEKISNINDMNKFNKENEEIHIFMDSSLENWTWEVCMYNKNKEKFDNFINVKENADYLYGKKDLGKVLGKMLNNKVETAYEMISGKMDFECPDYIEGALKWIKQ